MAAKEKEAIAGDCCDASSTKQQIIKDEEKENIVEGKLEQM